MANLDEINALLDKQQGVEPGSAEATPTSREMTPQQTPGSFMRMAILAPLLGPLAGKFAEKMEGTSVDAMIQGAGQGVTAGFADEAGGMVSGLLSKLSGGRFGEGQEAQLNANRSMLEQAKGEHGLAYGAGQIAGAVAPTIAAPGAGAGASMLGAASKMAATSAATSALTGFGEGEGGIANRVSKAIPAAILGGILGFGVGSVGYKLGQAVNAAKSTRPNILTLRDTKNAAYDAIKKSNEFVKYQDLGPLVNKAESELGSKFIYSPDTKVDKPVARVMAHIKKVIEDNGGQTIGELDKLKQDVMNAYNASPGKDARFLHIANAVDDMISVTPTGKTLVDAARAANSTFMQAKVLSKVISKADNAAHNQGVGANYSQKLKSNLSALLENESKSKWFTAEQKEAMQAVITGTKPANMMEYLGKFAPAGSGMTQGLLLMGTAANPMIGIVAGAGAGARSLSNAAAKGRASSLLDMVAGQAPQQFAQPISLPKAAAIGQIAPAITNEIGLDPVAGGQRMLGMDAQSQKLNMINDLLQQQQGAAGGQ